MPLLSATDCSVNGFQTTWLVCVFKLKVKELVG